MELKKEWREFLEFQNHEIQNYRTSLRPVFVAEARILLQKFISWPHWVVTGPFDLLNGLNVSRNEVWKFKWKLQIQFWVEL